MARLASTPTRGSGATMPIWGSVREGPLECLRGSNANARPRVANVIAEQSAARRIFPQANCGGKARVRVPSLPLSTPRFFVRRFASSSAVWNSRRNGLMATMVPPTDRLDLGPRTSRSSRLKTTVFKPPDLGRLKWNSHETEGAQSPARTLRPRESIVVDGDVSEVQASVACSSRVRAPDGALTLSRLLLDVTDC